MVCWSFGVFEDNHPSVFRLHASAGRFPRLDG